MVKNQFAQANPTTSLLCDISAYTMRLDAWYEHVSKKSTAHFQYRLYNEQDEHYALIEQVLNPARTLFHNHVVHEDVHVL